MKNIIILAFIPTLLLTNITHADTITVDGNAFLENQTNHSNIKVVFERVAPSALWDSTYSNKDGYYSIELESGIYNITYSKNGYNDELSEEQIIYSNTTLQNIILKEKPKYQVPSVFPTIQTAINASSDGDTIVVAPGTYYENINFNGKNITVTSHFLSTSDTTYISQTIINGNQNGHVVEFSSEEDSTAVLIGFTITNGYATGNWLNFDTYGGGIYCNGASPSLKSLIINNNTAEDKGGGICCWNCNSIISNVTIIENTANAGGGIDCVGGSPNITDVTIARNKAGQGGGIDCSADMILKNVTISNNTANDGGGICISGTCHPDYQNVVIRENMASGYGGGIYCLAGGQNMVNVIISNNTSKYDGAGIYSKWSMITNLTNVIISSNTAEQRCGGIFFDGDYLRLTHVNITDNNAISHSGIDYRGNNIVELGGGTELKLTNVIVSGNSNGGVYASGAKSLSISYSNFWNNGVEKIDDFGKWIGVNVTINANGDSCDAYYNIQLDPCFIYSESGDYHLRNNSPCIGAGFAFTESDIEGNIRGTPPDIGACENDLDSPIYVTIVEDIPNEFYLNAPYPNPFNPATTIKYSILQDSHVTLTIYNVSGQRISVLKDALQTAGNYSVTWNATGLPSGIYFCNFKANGFNATKKILLLK